VVTASCRSFFVFFVSFVVPLLRRLPLICAHPCSSLAERRRRSPFSAVRLSPAYTIIELLVVAGIIVLVSGLSIPMLYPLFARQSLDQAADIFKMSCMRARSRAIQERRNFQVIVTIKTTGNQQQTIRVQAEHWDDPAYFPVSTTAQQEYKARMADPAEFLPANTQFVLRSGSGPYTYAPYTAAETTYTFTFNPLGAVASMTGVSTQPDGYVLSLSDTKLDRVMSLYLYTTTGMATSEEVSR